MTTLDCHAVRLPNEGPTRLKRGTWNAICLVVEGEGRSTIGGETFECSRHDVFTIPHWTWVSHEAAVARWTCLSAPTGPFMSVSIWFEKS